ncbi:uncharacterized protein SPSK_03703 [Sporothrix schenckii 1099-18]|uniref:Uncharacterized protein n=1 Tax=Sporothrix schenckii 1099-18 TaxID=1397361 RepID=A0A0F2LYR2_SPOSC|nr:uncharacterized protein SPSK_03703 [Sporothrix schenckii 1099-18]KJR81969.1 hypothetical protein SPSK_03703 [Sporothrix schenckii 1099-18]
MPAYYGHTADTEIDSAKRHIDTLEHSLSNSIRRYNEAVDYAKNCEHNGRSRNTGEPPCACELLQELSVLMRKVSKAWKQVRKWEEDVAERRFRIDNARHHLDELRERRYHEEAIIEASHDRLPTEINQAIAREIYFSGRTRRYN